MSGVTTNELCAIFCMINSFINLIGSARTNLCEECSTHESLGKLPETGHGRAEREQSGRRIDESGDGTYGIDDIRCEELGKGVGAGSLENGGVSAQRE